MVMKKAEIARNAAAVVGAMAFGGVDTDAREIYYCGWPECPTIDNCDGNYAWEAPCNKLCFYCGGGHCIVSGHADCS